MNVGTDIMILLRAMLKYWKFNLIECDYTCSSCGGGAYDQCKNCGISHR